MANRKDSLWDYHACREPCVHVVLCLLGAYGEFVGLVGLCLAIPQQGDSSKNVKAGNHKASFDVLDYMYERSQCSTCRILAITPRVQSDCQTAMIISITYRHTMDDTVVELVG